MARIRTIKPELFRHEDLFEAELVTGLPLRLSFIALFTACDREGRFKWRPRQLKLDCLPYDEIDFSRVLDALATRGFIQKYNVLGVDYGCITSFTKHQAINNKESESVLPEPPAIPSEIDGETRVFKHEADEKGEKYEEYCGNLTGDPRVDDALITPLGKEQGEREGKGREKEGKGKGNTRAPRDKKISRTWPENFSVSNSVLAWYEKSGFTESIHAHFESFKNKCLAKDYKYADWDAAFRNAITDDWAGIRRQRSSNSGANQAQSRTANNIAVLQDFINGD